jgi:hypothetical protein
MIPVEDAVLTKPSPMHVHISEYSISRHMIDTLILDNVALSTNQNSEYTLSKCQATGTDISE